MCSTGASWARCAVNCHNVGNEDDCGGDRELSVPLRSGFLRQMVWSNPIRMQASGLSTARHGTRRAAT